MALYYALPVYRDTYRANEVADKQEQLNTFLDDFELSNLEKHLCADMKKLSFSKQAELSTLMDGIGNQITGRRNRINARGLAFTDTPFPDLCRHLKP